MLWYVIYFEMSAVNTASWVIYARWRPPQADWNVNGACKCAGLNSFPRTPLTNWQLILIHIKVSSSKENKKNPNKILQNKQKSTTTARRKTSKSTAESTWLHPCDSTTPQGNEEICHSQNIRTLHTTTQGNPQMSSIAFGYFSLGHSLFKKKQTNQQQKMSYTSMQIFSLKCLIVALKLSLKHGFKQFKETQEIVVEDHCSQFQWRENCVYSS